MVFDSKRLNYNYSMDEERLERKRPRISLGEVLPKRQTRSSVNGKAT